MLGVATPQLGSLIKLVQPFDRVLPDVSSIRNAPRCAEKALVNQRLQAVERDAGDLLCRLKREAGGKDARQANKCCSTRRAVRAPLDRCPQRLLAGVSIPATFEYVEAPESLA